MEKVKRAPAMGWKGILISIGLNLIFALVAALSIVGYFDGIEIQKIIDRGIIVEAEIVSVDRGGQSSARVWYRYESDDGILYESSVTGMYSTYTESLKHIGEKIEIYIGDVGSDGKGECWVVGKELNPNSNIVIACVFIFLIFLYIVLLGLYLLLYYDKLPKRKKR